jgi:hypothetical protein
MVAARAFSGLERAGSNVVQDGGGPIHQRTCQYVPFPLETGRAIVILHERERGGSRPLCGIAALGQARRVFFPCLTLELPLRGGYSNGQSVLRGSRSEFR